MPIGEKASRGLFIVSSPSPNTNDFGELSSPFYVLISTVLFSSHVFLGSVYSTQIKQVYPNHSSIGELFLDFQNLFHRKPTGKHPFVSWQLSGVSPSHVAENFCQHQSFQKCQQKKALLIQAFVKYYLALNICG